MLMTSSLASRNGFSGVSRSRCESELLGSVISVLTSARHCRFLLAAFNAEGDLHPLVVLLQDAVILAQGMSLPAIGQQDALHVGMPVKLDAEHVEDLALQPVRSRPDGNGAGQARAIQDLRFYANALVARERIKHPDHVELLLAPCVVHGPVVNTIVKLLFITKNLENLRNQGAIDHHVVLPGVCQRLDAGAVGTLELGDHGRIPGNRRGCGWVWRGTRVL